MSQVHRMCLNLLLLNQRAAVPSHFITPQKHTRSTMLSNCEKGGSTQTAEQRQRKQLCQYKHSI